MGGKKKNKSKRNKTGNANEHDAENILEFGEDIKDSDNITEDSSELSKKAIKRPNENDDSDSDTEKPKRPKKKKKQSVPSEESSSKKGKKSIRQIKREKFAQRQAEAQAVAKDQLKSQCLNYLSQWKHDRQNWKFMKAKQVWLYKNKFSTNLIPDSTWPVFLEYFESATGNIKNMLLNDANKIIKQMDDWTETQNKDGHQNENEDEEAAGDVQKPNDAVYNRARNLIQCLQE
ncbi:unnamed protein product, partial [Brenthis ino]